MSKPKNLLLQNLNEKTLGRSAISVCVLSENEDEMPGMKEIIQHLCGSFEDVDMDYKKTWEIPNIKDFDLIIPNFEYSTNINVNPVFEAKALRYRFRYYFIFEKHYKAVMLASRQDLIYRLYFFPIARKALRFCAAIFLVFPLKIYYLVAKNLSR